MLPIVKGHIYFSNNAISDSCLCLGVIDTTLYDQVCHCGFIHVLLVSSINKTDNHDITDIVEICFQYP